MSDRAKPSVGGEKRGNGRKERGRDAVRGVVDAGAGWTAVVEHRQFASLDWVSVLALLCRAFWCLFALRPDLGSKRTDHHNSYSSLQRRTYRLEDPQRFLTSQGVIFTPQAHLQ